MAFLPGRIQGAEYHWIPNASGAFTDRTKYQEGIAPAAGDWGVVTGGTNTINSATLTTEGGSLRVTGGTTTFTSSVYLDSVFTLDGDDTTSVTINSTLRVGETGSETAVLNVHGGTLTLKSWFAVGRSNSGRVNLTGGKIVLDSTLHFQIGDLPNASAELFISGGTLENKRMGFNIGNSTNTSVLIALSGTGALTSEKVLSFSRGQNSSSILRMTGGTLLANDGVTMGNGTNSQAEFHISGGNATVNKLFTIGNQSSSSATVTVSGGALTTNANIQVGAVAGSTASLEISGGTVNANGIHLNWHAGNGNSSLIYSGGTTSLRNLNARGESLIEVSGGDITISSLSYWGENTHYIQTGGTVHFLDTLRTGGIEDDKSETTTGTTILDIAGGTFKGNSWFGFGYDNPSQVNVHTGGTLQQLGSITSSSLTVGDGDSATLTLAGGRIEALTVRLRGNFHLNAASSGFGSIDASSYTVANKDNIHWGINAGVTVLDAAAYQNVITSTNTFSSPNSFTTGIQGIWDVTQNETQTAYSAQLADDFRLGEAYQNWQNTYFFENPTEKGWIALNREISSLGNYAVSLFLDSGEEDQLDELANWMENLLQYDPGLDLASYDEEQNTLTLHGFASELGERFLAFDFSQYNALMGTNFMATGFSAAAVPEPSTFLLLLSGMLFLAWKKYRQ